MTVVFESILPIFLLVLLGVWLKRSTFVDQSLWLGLEQFGYFILFPALLFSTLATSSCSLPCCSRRLPRQTLPG